MSWTVNNWEAIPVKQIQLYFYANNLGIIWKANHFGLDPDLIPPCLGRQVLTVLSQEVSLVALKMVSIFKFKLLDKNT